MADPAPVFVSYCMPPYPFAQSAQIGRLVKFVSRSPRVVAGRDDGPEDRSLLAVLGERRGNVEYMPWTASGRWRRRLAGIRKRDIVVPDAYRPWALNVVDRLTDERWSPAPAVIATFGQPMSDHLVGLQLSQRHAMPWVVHLSDPWLDNPYDHRPARARRRIAELEQRVVTAADRVVVTTDELAGRLGARYGADVADRTHVLTHAFDPALMPPRTAGNSDELVIRHVGAFYGPRRPEPLIDAFVKLRRRYPQLMAGVALEFVGPMSEPSVVDDPAIRVRGSVDYLESLRLMVDADLLVVVDAPARENLFLPSKLVEYVGAGRPLMAVSAPAGPSARMVRELGGPVADPTDRAGVLAALEQAIMLARDHQGNAGPWGSSTVRQRLEGAAVAASFDEIVELASVDRRR